MALRERAAAGVLSGEPHAEAVEQQRAERDQLRRTPSPSARVPSAIACALGEHRLQLRMRREAFRRRRQRVADVIELVARDRRVGRRLASGSR